MGVGGEGGWVGRMGAGRNEVRYKESNSMAPFSRYEALFATPRAVFMIPAHPQQVPNIFYTRLHLRLPECLGRDFANNYSNRDGTERKYYC